MAELLAITDRYHIFKNAISKRKNISNETLFKLRTIVFQKTLLSNRAVHGFIMPVILTLRRLRQEDHNFPASLGYFVRLSLK